MADQKRKPAKTLARKEQEMEGALKLLFQRILMKILRPDMAEVNADMGDIEMPFQRHRQR